jgi:hypothetical protein
MITLVRVMHSPGIVGPMGPKPHGHPSAGEQCPACGEPMAVGEFTALVALGPGGDEDARARAIAGLGSNAVAVEVHFRCATGREHQES